MKMRAEQPVTQTMLDDRNYTRENDGMIDRLRTFRGVIEVVSSSSLFGSPITDLQGRQRKQDP